MNLQSSKSHVGWIVTFAQPHSTFLLTTMVNFVTIMSPVRDKMLRYFFELIPKQLKFECPNEIASWHFDILTIAKSLYYGKYFMPKPGLPITTANPKHNIRFSDPTFWTLLLAY